jgi:diguanylate cyclase (GGDEF)-like protein
MRCVAVVPPGPSGLAVLVADLNGLKAINDTFGHAAGDAAIAALSCCRRGTVRRGDLVVRWGGDEFVVLARRADPEALADHSAGMPGHRCCGGGGGGRGAGL